MAKAVSLMVLVALSVIEHDLVKYGPGQDAGEEFECSEAQARPLIECGAAKRKAAAAAEEAAVGGGEGKTDAGTGGAGGDAPASTVVAITKAASAPAKKK